MKITNTGIYGTAKAKDIQNQGLINASLNIPKQKTIRRIIQYNGSELKGEELFNQLNIRYVKEESRTW